MDTNDNAAAWTATQMRERTEWKVSFNPQEVTEICAAVSESIESKRSISEISRENFKLPVLGDKLIEIHRELIHGRGFVLLRGMPVQALNREEIIRAYAGVGAWFGTAVSQNGLGHLVGHVKDIGNDPADPATRIYTTSYRQPFHTDSCDIVGLLCLQPARSGGQSAIASSTAIYLHMLEHNPTLAAQLKLPYTYDRKGEVPAGKQATYQMPVVHEHNGHISVIYARDFIDAALARFPDQVTTTALQLEALDEFDRLAHSDEFKLEMDFQQGDIQLLHNHQILHARTSYEDFEEPEKKRHLIRLWLSAHQPRELPSAYEERYGKIVPGQVRGGIRVPGVEPVTPLDAV